jgi:serine phosphatase RsbU (regulator of sigma subunit)
MLAALLFILFAASVDTLPTVPSPESLRADQGEALSVEWKYHPGDSLHFADPDYEDAHWRVVDPRFLRNDVPDDWPGIGWFRLHVSGDTLTGHRPHGLFVYHYGAAHVYLNGETVLELGEPAISGEQTITRFQRLAVPILIPAGDHVFAVRYANHGVERILRVQPAAGFMAVLIEPYGQASAHATGAARMASWRFFFVGMLGALAMIHLGLYAFYRQDKRNLYFFLAAVSLGVLTWTLVWQPTNVSAFINRAAILNTAAMATCGTMLFFAYRALWGRTPVYFYPVAAVLAGLVVTSIVAPQFFGWLMIAMLVTAVELVRIVAVALYKGAKGARIMGIGIVSLAIGVGYAMLGELGVFSATTDSTVFVPLLGMFGLAASMSVVLAREFAQTNQALAQRLDEVQHLSEARLEQERLLREEERRGEETRIALGKKAAELEEARQLQLSMLPSILPEHPDLEIAASMETATEVGGDYYDFHMSNDVLTIAVGDATGHGLRAGSMVTATKALFSSTMTNGHSLVDALRHSTRALKQMNLYRLFMALTLARWDGRSLRISAAGMPPVLVRRAATGAIEEIRITGMPLGGFADFPYQEAEVRLHRGDTVIFMSDGFPERFNPAGEMLGYDTARNVLVEAGHLPPNAIIEALKERASDHGAGRPSDDDTTFVVLRRR